MMFILISLSIKIYFSSVYVNPIKYRHYNIRIDHALLLVAGDINVLLQMKNNLFFADNERKKMRNKYILICFVTLTIPIFFFCWLKYFSQISGWKESSTTKYEFFISQMKQSGEPLGLHYISLLSILEMDRVRQILDLKLSEGEITISNQEAKILFYKTLALPLQSVCQ